MARVRECMGCTLDECQWDHQGGGRDHISRAARPSGRDIGRGRREAANLATPTGAGTIERAPEQSTWMSFSERVPYRKSLRRGRSQKVTRSKYQRDRRADPRWAAKTVDGTSAGTRFWRGVSEHYRQAARTRNANSWHSPSSLYSLNIHRARLRNQVSCEVKIYPV